MEKDCKDRRKGHMVDSCGTCLGSRVVVFSYHSITPHQERKMIKKTFFPRCKLVSATKSTPYSTHLYQQKDVVLCRSGINLARM